MKFKFRLAYYLFGLFLGAIFVIWFLKAKATDKGVEFCYLPNCRVLKDLRSKPFFYSEKASKILLEKWIDTLDIKQTLRYGDVDFGNSNTKNKGPKTYVVKGQTKAKKPIKK
jgi:hypothetical protein